MNHHNLILFILQICVMLAVAMAFGQVMRKFHQPAVLGELIGGVLLGPTIFGILAPNSYTWLFPVEGTVALGREAIIKIGMLFFLFSAGLEVNLNNLRHRGLTIVMISLTGSLIPFALGYGSVLLLPELWGSQAHDETQIFALFIGTALSISALPVIARILLDIELINKEIGGIIMTSAIIIDLFGWSLFAIILSVLDPNSPHRSLGVTLSFVVGFSVLILVSGRWLGQPLLRWARASLAWPSGFIGVVTVIVLASASLAETIGVHGIFGAFIVGIALNRSLDFEGKNHAHEIIHQFAVSFFAPLYFVSVGLKADFAANFDLPLVLLIIGIASLGKIGGAGLGAWLGKMSFREALAVGFGLNARGAMEMILALVALEYGLIDHRVFVALVVMALVTSMLSGPILKQLYPPRK